TPGRTLPNTGAKSRKRTQEVGEDAGAIKKHKPTTDHQSKPEGSVQANPVEAAPSGDGQRDKEKTIVETSEASPHKQSPKKDKKKKKNDEKEKKKKKKSKFRSKSVSGQVTSDAPPDQTTTVENIQPTPEVAQLQTSTAPGNITSIQRKESINSCLNDFGTKVRLIP
ncbi:hypothetical protein A2U01_0037811, partial [Trifolium medium]|nr:hypothetical protein [Trifolium medium]